MKCPLQIIVGLTRGDTLNPAPMDCIKEDCVWWCETQQRCAIAQLATDSTIISSELHQLVDKMPHELQFRRL